MKKIRVLHVLNMLNNGGIENLIMNMMRKIDREKYQFCFALIEHNPGHFDAEVKALGGEIYLFDNTEKSLKNYRKSLTRIIRDYGPFDVVHSHCYFFSGYILGIAKKCGAKVRIAHAHDTLKERAQTLPRRLYQQFMRMLIRINATNLVGCSASACRFVFGKDASFQVVVNGIDPDRFKFSKESRSLVRNELGLADRHVFVHVGRFSAQKNHRYLLRVFQEYVKIDKHARLLLVGWGGLANEIERWIEMLDLQNNVLMIGPCDAPERYYCAADCFLLPSLFEGFGIVSVEAQCSGLPCILSNTVPRECKALEYTWFIQTTDDDISQWVKTMERAVLVSIERPKCAERIKGSVFDIETTVQILAGVYSSAEHMGTGGQAVGE